MKTMAHEERMATALRFLAECWGCGYWSRQEQAFACAEGWSLRVFADDATQDRIVLDHDAGCWDFVNHAEAVAYVTRRAQEGSPLHARALVLHIASVLKYGP